MKTKQNIHSSVMKNIFLLLLLFTGIVEAQIVNIPDANFKTFLLSANTTTNAIAQDQFDNPIIIDTNGDGEIQNVEAEAIYSLGTIGNAFSNAIQSAQGIQAFINLKSIGFVGTQLTALDFSGLINLRSASIWDNNNLLSVNLSGLSNLKTLFCKTNYALTAINLSGLYNLETFTGYANRFTSLDLSDLNSLKYLDCGYNNLTTLNVIGLSQLNHLVFEENIPLTSVYLSGLPLVTDLTASLSVVSNNNIADFTIIDCPLVSSIDIHSAALANLTCHSSGIIELIVYSNNVSNVNLAGCSSLFAFGLTNCQVSSINLNGCSALKNVQFLNTPLTSIDLSQSLQLETVWIVGSQITTLDVSMLTQLSTLYITNNLQLKRVFMKNGSIESSTSFDGDNNLEFVCADESQIAAVYTVLNNAGFGYVVVNSYCSFTPGGNYNTITGNVKYDADNNGCDTNDVIFPYTRININDGSATAASFTHSSGNYTFYTQAGSFAIMPSIENPTWFNFSPPTATIPFADNNNNIATQDFCITANGIHPDIEVVIAPITPARPGFDAVYQIVYQNKGNQILSGNITFTYNDATLNFVSANPIPDTQNIGLLNWNYSNLKPFESRSLLIALNVNTPVDTPSVHVGDVLNFEASITPVIGDEFPNDNLFAFSQTVVGSFDPNDITCIEGDVVPPSEIGDYLHYIINFENTGTFPAENIVVKTEVDASKFDINSLQLMNSNFPVDARITGNKVEFIFENIQLPIGGHGHILLKVKTQNTLVTGDAVANRGDIFFDYNAPVDTGFANTVFQTLSNTGFEIDNSVVVSPNPASNEVSIKADNTIKSIQLYDVQGRIIRTSLVDESESKLEISRYSNGIYFLKITTAKGIKVQKLIKE